MPKKVPYNPADRAADLAMMRMQGRIKQTYAQAEREISKKFAEFTRKFKAKDAQYQKDVAEGKIDKKDYDAWRQGQIFQGKRWRAMREEMVSQIYRANKTATGVINGERRVVFQQNANYTAYKIEKDSKGAINFGLYDSATVTRLLKEDKKLLPEYKISEKKDYKWNNHKVNNAITQGIIQGESLDKIGKRLTESLEAGNRHQMLSFARTAMTGAQNAGRVEAMHDAEDMGIKVKKLWIATLDSHTRDTHAELDGQSVDIDEPFVVDGMEIMYPGDPNADPSLVYNCRCTLGYEYPDYMGRGERRDNETGEVIEYQTYKEWEAAKKGEETEKPNTGDQINPHAGDPMYDFSDIEEERKEDELLKQEAKDSWDEYHKIVSEQRQLERERAKINSLQRVAYQNGDFSKYHQLSKDEYSELHRKKTELADKLAEELRSYSRYRSDYGTEAEYQSAMKKYSEIRTELDAIRTELYNMPTYGMIQDQINAMRDIDRLGGRTAVFEREIELSQQIKEIEKKAEAAHEKYNEATQKSRQWNSFKLVEWGKANNIDYSVPSEQATNKSTNEIVDRLGGGDMTQGSCASLGFCYVGQKYGYDVLDFRGGSSQYLFSMYCDDILAGISAETGKPLLSEATKTGTGGAVKLIKQCVPGKEYYFSCGRHVAIVRASENGKLEYMELQSRLKNGWKLLGYKDDRASMNYTFSHRFGCGSRVNGIARMMDIDDMKDSKLLKRTYGYMNTAENEQKKGETGHER